MEVTEQVLKHVYDSLCACLRPYVIDRPLLSSYYEWNVYPGRKLEAFTRSLTPANVGGGACMAEFTIVTNEDTFYKPSFFSSFSPTSLDDLFIEFPVLYFEEERGDGGSILNFLRRSIRATRWGD